MIFLTIDTSQEDGYVALFEGETLAAFLSVAGKDQTATLLTKIDLLLSCSPFSLDDLSFLAVCTGPGSFTGTRIGAITAKTLAYAKKKTLIPYPSFLGRSPPIVFLSRRKGAIFKGNLDEGFFTDAIEPFSIEPTNPPIQRELDLASVGRYLAKVALAEASLPQKRVEIAYPDF